MSFEVDLYSSAWAHIALCADLTWVAEPPDEFIRANQRLWTQHCNISQATQESSDSTRTQERNSTNNKLADKFTSNQNQGGICNGRISVKDVIPESRLTQYGNFYYDDNRERCYANGNEYTNNRCNGQGSDHNDVTECWMLPEVEYWFQKLMDEQSDRGMCPRRRRHFRMLPADDFERCGPSAGSGEAALAARVRSVRRLWACPHPPHPPHPPPPQSRKMRARRRQPRRLNAPPLGYCLETPAPLLCDPLCKFQFNNPRVLDHRQNRLAIQSLIKNRTLQTYRGTNVSRYTPTSRPARAPDKRNSWLPKDQSSPIQNKPKIPQIKEPTPSEDIKDQLEVKEVETEPEEEKQKKEVVVDDDQTPSTSAAAMETCPLRKRLYSTVLSAPSPININQAALRLTQKLFTPGLLKLNPKIVLPRIRPVVENKFEELEKEALEQYKASDESIDTKFRELEKQAVEQYSTSNSNTSCSSAGKRTTSSPSIPEEVIQKNVDSVVIYSQNFPDLNAGKAQTTSGTNLKNLKTPPRGEKREQMHRPCKLRINTDDTGKRGPLRWTLHVVPPKKRHLSLCVSDMSSDDEVTIKDACTKDHVIGKVKMSAHGGGDLNPLIRKT